MKRVACALIVLTSAAYADELDPVFARATPAERTVLDELDKETYVKARTDAENILDDHPQSFVATWAMARIQHDEEGNHARALYYIRRAEQLLHDQFANPPAWDRKLLYEEYSIDEEMDRSADALEVIDRYDAKYSHSLEHLRIWPTFKLGRMDEARAIGRKLAASDDANDREHAYNGMLALEFEAHDRDAAYKWATEGVAITQGNSCILLRNASGVAYMRFRLREAEDLGLKAHEVTDPDCDGQGYDQLAGLYLVEGEFTKSVAALKSLKGTPIAKRYRPHFALQRRAILADILFALGKVDDAERLAAEVYALPERLGMISSTKRLANFVRSFRYWMALDVKLARQAERASYRPMFATLSVDDLLLSFTSWTIRRDLIQLCANSDFLVSITRPNLGELFQHGSWREMELIGALGTGIMRDAVAAARKDDARYPEAQPYLDLFDAEITYRQGDLSAALAAADAALPKLAKEEAMLRWRTLAWEGEALRRQGKLEAARPLFHEVLQKAPSLLRIVGAVLPVTVVDDGSPLAAAAAARLGSSPRFDVRSRAPFKISVSTNKAGVISTCLTDDSGFSFVCADGEKKKTDEDSVVSALDAFHDAAFSPKVSLDQSDLNSLDGSPVRASSDQVLKGILEP